MSEEPIMSDKEPGNWELYRGIERVEKAVHDMSANSLTNTVFAIEKQALLQQIAALQKTDTEQQAATLLVSNTIKDYTKEQDAQKKEQEAQKGRNRLFIYGLILSPIVAVVVSYAANGGFTP